MTKVVGSCKVPFLGSRGGKRLQTIACVCT
jgi:hypothetical protein